MKAKAGGISGQDRRFLLLQGPHGPFFRALGRMLGAAGAEVWRVGFNRGDEFFWGLPGYIPFDAPAESRSRGRGRQRRNGAHAASEAAGAEQPVEAGAPDEAEGASEAIG